MAAPEHTTAPQTNPKDIAPLESMQEISTGFRVYLWFSAIVGGGYGLCYLFFASWYLTLVKWPFRDPVMAGLLGCTLLALAVGAGLCLRARYWLRIKLFIEYVIVWFAIVSVYDLYTIIGIDFPADALPSVYIDTAINVGLCAGFVYFYRRHQQEAGRVTR